MENFIMNIEKVIDYIELHLDEKLDLEKVSEAVHFIRFSSDLCYTRRFYPKVLQKKISALLKKVIFRPGWSC